MAQDLELFGPNSYGAKAEEDMVNACAVIPARIGTPRAGAFWCEQAIEKYFKHVMVDRHNQEELISRHKLLPLAKDVGFTLSQQDRILMRELGDMYYERYPVRKGEEIPEDPTWCDVDEILKLALRVQKWTYSILLKRKRNTANNVGKIHLD